MRENPPKHDEGMKHKMTILVCTVLSCIAGLLALPEVRQFLNLTPIQQASSQPVAATTGASLAVSTPSPITPSQISVQIRSQNGDLKILEGDATPVLSNPILVGGNNVSQVIRIPSGAYASVIIYGQNNDIAVSKHISARISFQDLGQNNDVYETEP